MAQKLEKFEYSFISNPKIQNSFVFQNRVHSGIYYQAYSPVFSLKPRQREMCVYAAKCMQVEVVKQKLDATMFDMMTSTEIVLVESDTEALPTKAPLPKELRLVRLQLLVV